MEEHTSGEGSFVDHENKDNGEIECFGQDAGEDDETVDHEIRGVHDVRWIDDVRKIREARIAEGDITEEEQPIAENNSEVKDESGDTVEEEEPTAVEEEEEEEPTARNDSEVKDECEERMDSSLNEKSEGEKPLADMKETEAEDGEVAVVQGRWKHCPDTLKGNSCIPLAYFGPGFDRSSFQCSIRVFPVTVENLYDKKFQPALKHADSKRIRFIHTATSGELELELLCQSFTPLLHYLMLVALDGESVNFVLEKRQVTSWTEVVQKGQYVSAPTGFDTSAPPLEVKFTLKQSYFQKYLSVEKNKALPSRLYKHQDVKNRSVFLCNLPARADIGELMVALFPLALKVSVVEESENERSAVLLMKSRATVIRHLFSVLDLCIDGQKAEMGTSFLTQQEAAEHNRVKEEKKKENKGKNTALRKDKKKERKMLFAAQKEVKKRKKEERKQMKKEQKAQMKEAQAQQNLAGMVNMGRKGDRPQEAAGYAWQGLISSNPWTLPGMPVAEELPTEHMIETTPQEFASQREMDGQIRERWEWEEKDRLQGQFEEGHHGQQQWEENVQGDTFRKFQSQSWSRFQPVVQEGRSQPCCMPGKKEARGEEELQEHRLDGDGRREGQRSSNFPLGASHGPDFGTHPYGYSQDHGYGNQFYDFAKDGQADSTAGGHDRGHDSAGQQNRVAWGAGAANTDSWQRSAGYSQPQAYSQTDDCTYREQQRTCGYQQDERRWGHNYCSSGNGRAGSSGNGQTGSSGNGQTGSSGNGQTGSSGNGRTDDHRYREHQKHCHDYQQEERRRGYRDHHAHSPAERQSDDHRYREHRKRSRDYEQEESQWGYREDHAHSSSERQSDDHRYGEQRKHSRDYEQEERQLGYRDHHAHSSSESRSDDHRYGEQRKHSHDRQQDERQRGYRDHHAHSSSGQSDDCRYGEHRKHSHGCQQEERQWGYREDHHAHSPSERQSDDHRYREQRKRSHDCQLEERKRGYRDHHAHSPSERQSDEHRYGEQRKRGRYQQEERQWRHRDRVFRPTRSGGKGSSSQREKVREDCGGGGGNRRREYRW